MKGFSKLKTIQLILFLAVTVIGLIIVFTDSQLYQMIGYDSHVRMLCIILWVALALAFVFMFLDFRLDSQILRENEELNYAFYTDPDTGVANRNSCDAFINQYRNRLLPDGMAAFTVVLTNLKDLNDKYGYESGDTVINEFAELLQQIVPKNDFLGRNGGDKFLIVLKKCTTQDKNELLGKLKKAVETHNQKASEDGVIEYKAGAALQLERHAKTMNALVAVSDRNARS